MEGRIQSDSDNMRSLQYKPDFDQCIERIYAWYNQRIIDRPPVRFLHHEDEYEKLRTVEGPWKTDEDRWLDVEFQVQTFMDSLETTEFLGETFPVYWPNLSTLAYNLFLGQPAVFDDVTAWTQPCIDDLEDLPPLKVQRDGRYFKAVEAMTRRALELAEGRFMVGYTEMYAGVDCAAMLRAAENLCMDLVLRPEPVKHLIELVFEEFPQVFSHFDGILKDHIQLSVTWMNLPSFETLNVLACDFATHISPGHFEEFCLPLLRKEARLFQHNVYHLDGPGVARHIDAILTLPNLQAVHWVQGYGSDEPIMQWLPLIRKIQEAGKSVVVDLKMQELGEFMNKVDPTGTMLWMPAQPSDQRDILERVSNW
jgi:hypothetical protein